MEKGDATDKAIGKFFVCKTKLDSFTKEELLALSKSFIYYVAANAVKEIWQHVPKSWTQDPVLSELQPCTDYDHHKQVAMAKIPSMRQCATCQLAKLYHDNKSPCKDFVESFHGCHGERKQQLQQQTQTSSTEEEEDQTF